jgi:hypothetical protein
MPIGIGNNIYRALAGPNDPANDARALLGQGVAMGWGDELEAAYRAYGPGAMQAFGATLTTPGAAPPPAYDKVLPELQAKYEAYAKRNPGRAAGLEFAGSVLPFLAPAGAAVTGARGASRAATVGKATLEGTALGALYGAGTGKTGRERVENAIGNGIFGALAGAVPAAGLVYSPELLALAKKYGPQVALTLAGLTAPAAAKKPAPRKPPPRK